jgi:hypothetical protein
MGPASPLAARSMDQLAAASVEAFDKGNIPLAEIMCRAIVERWKPSVNTLNLMGRIAAALGEHETAIAWYRRALEMNPYFKPVTRNLKESERLLPTMGGEGTDAWRRERLAAGQPSGHLIIKAWGHGFWSDVNQALGHLLTAEITGRVPVMDWGPNSLFGRPGTANAWELYFQPVSGVRPQDLAGAPGLFPPKWNAANIGTGHVDTWNGDWSRMTGLLMLNRPEGVAVVDFQTSAAGLTPWIPRGHAMHGRSSMEVYRYLSAKYLRPQPDIASEVEAFWREHLAGSPTIAVHLRGSDKISEVVNLGVLTADLERRLQDALGAQRDARIFLLTDATTTLDRYRAAYGKRLVATECRRTTVVQGLHFAPDLPADRRRLGIEVLKDALLAARCDRFFGLAPSAVSALIETLKDWKPGACTLLGRNYHTTAFPEIFMR